MPLKMNLNPVAPHTGIPGIIIGIRKQRRKPKRLAIKPRGRPNVLNGQDWMNRFDLSHGFLNDILRITYTTVTFQIASAFIAVTIQDLAR